MAQRGFSLNLSKLKGSSQDQDGTQTAASLVASMQSEMNHNRHSLNTFIGNFQQLLKCEMGTNAFKGKLDLMLP